MPVFRDDFPRWQQLITPGWLDRLMAGVAVRAAPASHWCLLEVDCGALDAFLQRHIPGAAYLDTACLEEGPFWNKVADAALLQVLLGLGIRHDTTVILYGRNMTAAARAAHAWLMGWERISVYDGGWFEWSHEAQEAGHRLHVPGGDRAALEWQSTPEPGYSAEAASSNSSASLSASITAISAYCTPLSC